MVADRRYELWRSYFIVSILPGMAFSRFHRFTRHWKGPYEPFVIGFALNIGGRRWVRPKDAVENA
jgi:hypothetical protein